MSHAEKRRFIKDPVWGEVEFFSWERELFDHPLVNRLHGVGQTSCTFKVYPSLKYSRFAHSIGALHAVTQLFVNIARNLRVNAACADSEADRQRCNNGRNQFSSEATLINERFSWKGDAEHLEKMRDVLCCAFPVSREDALALAVVRIGALPFTTSDIYPTATYLRIRWRVSSTAHPKGFQIRQRLCMQISQNLKKPFQSVIPS